MIYTHVLNRGPAGVRSPLDSLGATEVGCEPRLGNEGPRCYPDGPRRLTPRRGLPQE
jgi:hypothetical protein